MSLTTSNTLIVRMRLANQTAICLIELPANTSRCLLNSRTAEVNVQPASLCPEINTNYCVSITIQYSVLSD